MLHHTCSHSVAPLYLFSSLLSLGFCCIVWTVQGAYIICICIIKNGGFFLFSFRIVSNILFNFLTQARRYCLLRMTWSFLKITHIYMYLKIPNTSVWSCGLLLIIWIIVGLRNPCNMFQTLTSVFTFSNFRSVYSSTNMIIKHCIWWSLVLLYVTFFQKKSLQTLNWLWNINLFAYMIRTQAHKSWKTSRI